MSTNSAGLTDLLLDKMRYLNQKQAVHAENIANSSTPGYKAREIAPFTFNDAMQQASVGMKVTDPRHIIPASMSGSNGSTKVARVTEKSPDGNAVDTEQETTNSSKTNVEYQLITSIYKKMASFFKLALKGSA
jgi:flagellar basal-body rod protein FlgB